MYLGSYAASLVLLGIVDIFILHRRTVVSSVIYIQYRCSVSHILREMITVRRKAQLCNYALVGTNIHMTLLAFQGYLGG